MSSNSRLEEWFLQVVKTAKKELRISACSQHHQVVIERMLPIAAGVATFGSVSAAGCWTQLLCGISTGTAAPVPTAAGVITVCLASLASHSVAHYTQQHCTTTTTASLSLLHDGAESSHPWWTKRRDPEFFLLGSVQIPMHTVRMYVVVALL